MTTGSQGHPHDTDAFERRFRRRTRQQDRRLTSLLVILVATAAFGYGVLDVVFYADGLSNGPILAIRAAAILSSIVVVFVLRRATSSLAFDRTVAVWLASIMAMQLAVAILRPGGWSPVTVINMLLILGTYTLVPVPIRYQAVPTLLFSVANVVLVATASGSMVVGRIQIASLAAYLLANVVGILVSIRHQHLRRRQFRVLDRERAARLELRRALDEVKTLRGIIPICSVCKKVRNDEGLYEAVEAYLVRCSDVDFSHTLCPDCLGDRYPDRFGLVQS